MDGTWIHAKVIVAQRANEGAIILNVATEIIQTRTEETIAATPPIAATQPNPNHLVECLTTLDITPTVTVSELTDETIATDQDRHDTDRHTPVDPDHHSTDEIAATIAARDRCEGSPR